MWNKATIGGAVAAVLLGTAGVAMASAHGTSAGPQSPSQVAATATAPGNATPAKANPQGAKHGKGEAMLGRLKGMQHAEWVAKDKAGAFVTHQAIAGDVTAVSATSITVKAEDGVSLTFAVTADTKIRVRADGKDAQGNGAPGKGTDAKIADVKTGQKAVVSGTGKDAPAAAHIVVRAS